MYDIVLKILLEVEIVIEVGNEALCNSIDGVIVLMNEIESEETEMSEKWVRACLVLYAYPREIEMVCEFGEADLLEIRVRLEKVLNIINLREIQMKVILEFFQRIWQRVLHQYFYQIGQIVITVKTYPFYILVQNHIQIQ